MGSVPETTYELLVQSARAALDLQRDNGSFPPGRAGAYDYPLTPVRTTGTWLVTLTKAYEITGEEAFSTAADSAIDYLLSDEIRPYGYTFRARNSEQKDMCDGLVGQAAPIYGLSYAGRILDHEEALTVAKAIFEVHPFHEQLGLWERVEIDGTRLSFDRTLNHQIIFASSAIPLAQYFDSVNQTCNIFLDELVKNMDVHDDGLPRHYVRPSLQDVLPVVASAPRHWLLLWNEFAVRYHSYLTQRRRKEIGYYPVITAELARLMHNWPDHEIWTSVTLQRVLSFLDSEEYENVLDEKMAYGSVVPWLDHATTVWSFRNPTCDELRGFIGKTIENNYDSDACLFVKNADDPEFQATVVSDLALLPDIQLETNETVGS